MRLCSRRLPDEYWDWVRHYPFEVSLVATALRATLVAFLTLTGMVMLGGVAAAEAVMLSQVVPYIILTALRACYLESVWRVAGPVRTA